MKEFTVYGTVQTNIEVVINLTEEEMEGLSNEEIQDVLIEKAYDDFGGISAYLGNGGDDKIIGVTGSNESIHCENDPEFYEAKENGD